MFFWLVSDLNENGDDERILSIRGTVVFWAAGIVLFLAKIINLHDPIKQRFWTEVCQQVVTGRFLHSFSWSEALILYCI